jgi:hypothetical protein
MTITKEQIKQWAEKRALECGDSAVVVLRELLGRAFYERLEGYSLFELKQELHTVHYSGGPSTPICDYTLDEALQRVLDDIITGAHDNSNSLLTLEQVIELNRSLWYFDSSD